MGYNYTVNKTISIQKPVTILIAFLFALRTLNSVGYATFIHECTDCHESTPEGGHIEQIEQEADHEPQENLPDHDVSIPEVPSHIQITQPTVTPEHTIVQISTNSDADENDDDDDDDNEDNDRDDGDDDDNGDSGKVLSATTIAELPKTGTAEVAAFVTGLLMMISGAVLKKGKIH